MRGEGGDPVVIRNDPLLDDGTPMPTRYWLVDRRLRLAIDRLESGGRGAGRRGRGRSRTRWPTPTGATGPSGTPPSRPHGGPRPSGGVGGTRKGVKCLHAHYAWYLAGGDDPVGRWVAERLARRPSLDLAVRP